MIDAVSSLQPGEHACFVYGSEAERRGMLREFLSLGLQRGDMLAYFDDPAESGGGRDLLADLGVHVDELLAAERLAIVPSRPARATGDDGVRALASTVRGLAERARRSGYRSLRAVGETWALRRGLDIAHVAAYEFLADRIVASGDVIALCCYDARRTAEDDLSTVAGVHPLRPSRLRAPLLSVFANADATSVVGEADAVSSPLLGVLRFAEGPDVTLDLSGLSFVDASALRTIAQLARLCEDRGGYLILRDPVPMVSRCLSLVGLDRLPALQIA